MKRYLLFAFACAGISVLGPLATAQGSKDPVAARAAKTRTPEDPKLVWTASNVVLIPKELAPGVYAIYPDGRLGELGESRSGPTGPAERCTSGVGHGVGRPSFGEIS